jgi:hypothetical protein
MYVPFRILTLTIALAAVLPFAAQAADPIGKVIFQSGGAFIVDAAGKQRAANKGDLILPGERLVTGANTLTQVKMRDGSFVGLRPGTDLKFQEMRLTGKDAGQDVALNSGSIRVLNLPGDGAVKPLPVNVQAGDARIVMRGADLESAVKRDLTTGPETFTRLNQGTGILSNGIKTLDLAVNGVNSATKVRITDAPISALPPVSVRTVSEAAPVKDIGVAPIQVAVPKGDLTATLPIDARGATDLAMTQGLKNTIVSTITPATSLSGISTVSGFRPEVSGSVKEIVVKFNPADPTKTELGVLSGGTFEAASLKSAAAAGSDAGLTKVLQDASLKATNTQRTLDDFLLQRLK